MLDRGTSRNGRHAVDPIERLEVLCQRVLVGAGLVVEHEIERAFAEQLLALPDERLLVQRQPLELIRGEFVGVVAGVDVRLALLGVVGEDLVHAHGEFLHLQVLFALEVRVDDRAQKFDLTGF